MTILLVEDRPRMRESYKESIADYNSDIKVLDPKSFDELETMLLTRHFDHAIIDYNLSNWNDGSNSSVSDGVELCERLVETKNFTNSKTSVFLYTAYHELTEKNDHVPYSIVAKTPDIDVIQKFQDDLLAKMKGKGEIDPPVTLNEFKQYPEGKQIRHYKRILNLDKENHRFSETEECVLWISDLLDNTRKKILGKYPPSKKTRNTLAGQYRKLDQQISAIGHLPNIFWNYASEDHFPEQVENRPVTENKCIEIPFGINLAKSMSEQLLKVKDNKRSFCDFLKLVSAEVALIKRELQCQLIETMLANSDKGSDIRNMTTAVAGETGFHVREYFDATLNSFDVESDVAHVRLRSRIDPNIYSTRQFRYSRLKENGILYKETNFYYYVSADGGNLSAYIEPK